jgi:hypoxanthine phosphoribosyltransferase
MKNIINVYDENDNVIKTSEATEATIKFGAIRSLMKLLNVDDINDTGELLKTIYKAWEELTKILSKCFPDMTDEDWDNVKLNELVPVVVQILKDSFSEILTIPNDSKN